MHEPRNRMSFREYLAYDREQEPDAGLGAGRNRKDRGADVSLHRSGNATRLAWTGRSES